MVDIVLTQWGKMDHMLKSIQKPMKSETVNSIYSTTLLVLIHLKVGQKKVLKVCENQQINIGARNEFERLTLLNLL